MSVYAKDSTSPLVSVIIPIYNVEAYLEECVRSVRNQTYTNLEIILVDDGSPDRCGELCDAYAAEDERIRVIHRQNGGLSAARNSALAIATSEFVTFVDSDDWIAPDFLRQAVEILAADDQIDVVQAPYVCYYDETGTLEPGIEHLPQGVSDRADVLRRYTGLGQITNHVWGKVYRRSCIQGLSFPEGRLMEDVPYTMECFLRVRRVAWLAEPMYVYRRQRPGSIMAGSTDEANYRSLMENLGELLSRPTFDREAKGWINTLLYNHLYRAWVVLHGLYAGKSGEDYQRVREFFLRWATFSKDYPYYNVHTGRSWLRGELQRWVHKYPAFFLRLYEWRKGS